MKKTITLLLALLLCLTVFAACATETATTPTPTPDDVVVATDPVDTSPTEEPAATPTPEEPTPEPPADPVELVVFAAASMKETMDQIATLYKDIAPNVTITYTFDSSGTLLTQIQEGAEADIFISAAQKQMNTLADDNALLAETRFDLVENKVALVVPSGNPANITSFDDAIDADSIALGNSDVPVGQYSEEIFISLGVWDAVSAKATLGANVKEVQTWVSEAVVDCGIVYATDAFSAGLEIVADAPEGTLKTPVVYPASVLAMSKSVDAAKAFLEFLKTPEAFAVFEAVGFAKP